jgi:hypothetical protein
MLDVSLAGWATTVAAIGVLFMFDLFVSRPGHAREVGFREAVIASVFYVTVASVFGVVFGLIAGWDYGGQYFAGYIVEKSLSVDNLFVFVVMMTTFAVPAEYQQRVLTSESWSRSSCARSSSPLAPSSVRPSTSCSQSSVSCSCSPRYSSSATATRTPTSRTTALCAPPAA